MTIEEIIQKWKDTFPEADKCECDDHRNSCRYASQGDNKPGCAVGIFLDPEDAELFDNSNVTEGSVTLEGLMNNPKTRKIIDEKYPFFNEHLDLFTIAQNVHDNPSDSCWSQETIRLEIKGKKYWIPRPWKERWIEFFKILDECYAEQLA